MKKTLLLTALLLAMTVTVAMAAGVNFNWGTVCYTEAPMDAKTFACNTNTATGNLYMTSSFVIDTPMADMVGIEFIIEGQSDQPTLPAWWQVGAAPDCRATRSSFTSNLSAVAGETCWDWNGGQAFNVYQYTWDTNRAHISAGCAIAADVPFYMEPGLEYYAGKIDILNNKTVGTGACTGCSYGFKWALTSLVIAGLDGRRDLLDLPIPGGNQCLTYNNSVIPCAAPIPAKNTTWGQVKSLYR